ncbi:HAMP domain-containing protein [Candidatus Acetothermia bacterium]|nr:HAMP domain-containing protein [Candidatus Acetothermia bacterium]MCI2427010.1 HAMP domain-containing protein [Candidatus Acetothermia bacterium]MCI2428452.1 HAMP domain-containing protein [Candidatus Acetothermia bacterium]
MPIRVREAIVGIVLPLKRAPWQGLLEQHFLRTVNRSLWIVAFIAGGIGILLSVILLRQFTGPLRKLAVATHQIALGQLSKRVVIHSDDELGRLGKSFNAMAASLEQAEESKQQLISAVSHELRTPLTIVRTGLEGMRDGVLDPTAENFTVLHNKILLTTRLVADLQQLASADAGQMSIHMEPCSLHRLLEEIIVSSSSRVPIKRISSPANSCCRASCRAFNVPTSVTTLVRTKCTCFICAGDNSSRLIKINRPMLWGSSATPPFPIGCVLVCKVTSSTRMPVRKSETLGLFIINASLKV